MYRNTEEACRCGAQCACSPCNCSEPAVEEASTCACSGGCGCESPCRCGR